jgi:hypothetical protein
MRIIKHKQGTNEFEQIYNIYPDQFVSQVEKESDKWVKSSMDYFYTVAMSQYNRNNHAFSKNYKLLKGIIDRTDFYDAPEVQSFVETLTKDVELPSDIKHYTILNPPLNTLIGEITKRPDNSKVKAMDDDSKNEELQFRTDLLHQFILSKARQKLYTKLAEQGLIDSIPEEEFEAMSEESVKEYLTSYTSVAEKWANKVLESLKVEFNMKEKSEEAFRDMLVTSREFYHIYEDNSKLGFNVEVLNPKNVWYLSSPDKKYIKDAYCVGTVEIMELSEILDKFELSKDNVDALIEQLNKNNLFEVRESNAVKSNPPTGDDSVTYDTYDPLVLQERMLAESRAKSELESFLGLGSSISSFGHKFAVVRAYWRSKKKIGKLTYWDEDGVEQVELVDENYETIPNEISIEWAYINQWYQGVKIGDILYDVKPFELLEYSPIIGVVHESKNTEPKSLVDLMKPFQVLYNICMNQLFRLLDKDLGVQFLTSIRHVPKTKDGDAQDALETWELDAKQRGIIFLDDSPENTKTRSSFNQHARVDLSRHNEIQARYNLAAQLKMECWELVGISRERSGSVAATTTATGVQTALTQSYSQTEPYFVQHEYVLNQLYQAMVDAAQYIEVTKPTSTLSYVNTQGEDDFINVNPLDIKAKDLKVFVTSRAEDKRIFDELRALAQPMLQNGASVYDIAVLYSTNSVMQMKQVFKTLKEQQEAMQQQQIEAEQARLEQEAQIAQAQLQQAAQEKAEDRINENYNKELDRLNKKEVALINALGRNENAAADTDGNGVADALEVSRLSLDQMDSERKYNLELRKAAQKDRVDSESLNIEREKIKLEREKLDTQLKVEKMKLRNPVSGESKRKTNK